jgi:DNA-directed RNA polymerase alpha subunit
MKIHVEFNSIAEMVNFSKFAGNDLVQPPQPKKDQESLQAYKDAYERTNAHLERAYERLREINSNKKIKAILDTMEIEKNAIAYDKRKEQEQQDVGNLEISVRAYNCLRSENIYTIPELVTKTENDLRKIPNMGKVSIKEIKDALAKINLRLAE